MNFSSTYLFPLSKILYCPPPELVFAFFLVSIFQSVKKQTKLMWKGCPADSIDNPNSLNHAPWSALNHFVSFCVVILPALEWQ